MAQQKIVVKGKLDYTEDGVWLIRDIKTGTRILDGFLYPLIGKPITILVDEPEEAQEED